MRWPEHVTHVGQIRNAHKICQKPELKKPLERKENTRTVLKEIAWEGVEWIHLTEDRNQWQAFVNIVIKHFVLLKVMLSM
jgi:hypothetical protein